VSNRRLACAFVVATFLTGCTSARPCVENVHGTMLDGLVDVGGGVALHLHCVGQGAPTVVFDAGAGGDGAGWSRVQPAVSRTTRACVYDRAGVTYSTPLAKPHTSREIVAQLHTLLARAGVPGPYVFVAHSFGGLNVRLYASEHPALVAGMVLVDASSDVSVLDLVAKRMKLQLPPLPKRPSILPPPEIDADAATESMAQVRATKLRQTRASEGSTVPPLDVPLFVLSRGKFGPPPPGISEEQGPDIMRILNELQAELAHLSSNSAWVIASDSGHDIPDEAPHLVTASVRAVIDAVRARGRIDAAAVLALPGAANPDHP
jgi:pimeloyl-ACP methyl ester carboxylesterase